MNSVIGDQLMAVRRIAAEPEREMMGLHDGMDGVYRLLSLPGRYARMRCPEHAAAHDLRHLLHPELAGDMA